MINCKVELSLKWIENCVLATAPIGANADATGADSATFEITGAKLCVLIVTLSAEDNVKLSKLLGEGFKSFIYWNNYKVIDSIVVRTNNANEDKYIRKRLDASCPGVKRLFVLAYDNTAGNIQVSVDSFKTYFLSRDKIENNNIDIDGRNFLISQLMTQLNNTTKSEKYQQDKGMITGLVAYWVFLILEKITDQLHLL